MFIREKTSTEFYNISCMYRHTIKRVFRERGVSIGFSVILTRFYHALKHVVVSVSDIEKHNSVSETVCYAMICDRVCAARAHT